MNKYIGITNHAKREIIKFLESDQEAAELFCRGFPTRPFSETVKFVLESMGLSGNYLVIYRKTRVFIINLEKLEQRSFIINLENFE